MHFSLYATFSFLSDMKANPVVVKCIGVRPQLSPWVSMSTLSSGASEKARPVAQKPEPVVAKRDSDVGTTWVVLGGLGFLAYVVFGAGSNHRPASQPPPPAVVAKPVAATPVNSYLPAPSMPMPQPTAVTTQPKRPPKSPFQRCLEIKSDDKMAKCLEALG